MIPLRTIALAAAVAFVSAAGAGTVSIAEAAPAKFVKPQLLPRGKFLKLRWCPDPAVTNISVRYVTRGRVRIARITVEIRNIGNVNWRSGANQQSLRVSLGGSRGLRLGARNFTMMRVGQVNRYTYAIPVWRLRRYGRYFSVNARISLDPDIYLDSNRFNDDCNQRNNAVRRGFRV